MNLVEHEIADGNRFHEAWLDAQHRLEGVASAIDLADAGTQPVHDPDAIARVLNVVGRATGIYPSRTLLYDLDKMRAQLDLLYEAMPIAYTQIPVHYAKLIELLSGYLELLSPHGVDVDGSQPFSHAWRTLRGAQSALLVYDGEITSDSVTIPKVTNEQADTGLTERHLAGLYGGNVYLPHRRWPSDRRVEAWVKWIDDAMPRALAFAGSYAQRELATAYIDAILGAAPNGDLWKEVQRIAEVYGHPIAYSQAVLSGTTSAARGEHVSAANAFDYAFGVAAKASEKLEAISRREQSIRATHGAPPVRSYVRATKCDVDHVALALDEIEDEQVRENVSSRLSALREWDVKDPWASEAELWALRMLDKTGVNGQILQNPQSTHALMESVVGQFKHGKTKPGIPDPEYWLRSLELARKCLSLTRAPEVLSHIAWTWGRELTSGELDEIISGAKGLPAHKAIGVIEIVHHSRAQVDGAWLRSLIRELRGPGITWIEPPLVRDVTPIRQVDEFSPSELVHVLSVALLPRHVSAAFEHVSAVPWRILMDRVGVIPPSVQVMLALTEEVPTEFLEHLLADLGGSIKYAEIPSAKCVEWWEVACELGDRGREARHRLELTAFEDGRIKLRDYTARRRDVPRLVLMYLETFEQDPSGKGSLPVLQEALREHRFEMGDAVRWLEWPIALFMSTKLDPVFREGLTERSMQHPYELEKFPPAFVTWLQEEVRGAGLHFPEAAVSRMAKVLAGLSEFSTPEDLIAELFDLDDRAQDEFLDDVEGVDSSPT